MAGRPSNEYLQLQRQYIESDILDDWDQDEEETFPDEDTKDLLEGMGNYRHLDELEDYES